MKYRMSASDSPCAWRAELEVPSHLHPENIATWTADEVLLATTEKKQRTEVRLTSLPQEERKAFQEAKEADVQNWLKTGTVSKIRRSQLAPEQIPRCVGLETSG